MKKLLISLGVFACVTVNAQTASDSVVMMVAGKQYYYNLNKKDEYLKLYDPQLDNKVKNPLFKIMYLILNEEYEEALELSKKVTSQQKDIGYIMKLYYRIICLEHLEKENELNDCINEMVEFNDQIHYVKGIKDKYKK